MERECKVCGRTYRGLVCHACHPRKHKMRSPDSAQMWTPTMTQVQPFVEQTVQAQADQVHDDGQG